MKKIKSFALTALATVTAIAPTAVKANNIDDAHWALAATAAQTGVEFKINPASCWKDDAFGWYWAAKNELVVCQEYRRRPNVETNWTAEDLDTLRHEVQHLVQDCMDGRRDGRLTAVYNHPIDLAKQVLGTRGIKNVVKAYSEETEHIKVMELEAFAVAALNDPREQIQDVKRFCF